jgi:hypothetical protein
MKRIVTGTAASLVLGLTGFGLAQVASAAPVASADAKRASLVAAASAYANALLSGDGLAVADALSDFCADAEIGDAVYAADLIARKAHGATLAVTSVAVDGDRGSVTGYRLSPGAPAALFSPGESAATYPWRWVDGRWYFQGGCGVAPSGSAGPVRTAVAIG